MTIFVREKRVCQGHNLNDLYGIFILAVLELNARKGKNTKNTRTRTVYSL